MVTVVSAPCKTPFCCLSSVRLSCAKSLIMGPICIKAAAIVMHKYDTIAWFRLACLVVCICI
ncbi:hypothetical protein BDR03DRAFT_939559 [Suillus americanus]|nr:hypothetical protein BDR03DRAFT_939559 [Suillus americanus]